MRAQRPGSAWTRRSQSPARPPVRPISAATGEELLLQQRAEANQRSQRQSGRPRTARRRHAPLATRGARPMSRPQTGRRVRPGPAKRPQRPKTAARRRRRKSPERRPMTPDTQTTARDLREDSPTRLDGGETDEYKEAQPADSPDDTLALSPEGADMYDMTGAGDIVSQLYVNAIPDHSWMNDLKKPPPRRPRQFDMNGTPSNASSLWSSSSLSYFGGSEDPTAAKVDTMDPATTTESYDHWKTTAVVPYEDSLNADIHEMEGKRSFSMENSSGMLRKYQDLDVDERGEYLHRLSDTLQAQKVRRRHQLSSRSLVKRGRAPRVVAKIPRKLRGQLTRSADDPSSLPYLWCRLYSMPMSWVSLMDQYKVPAPYLQAAERIYKSKCKDLRVPYSDAVALRFLRTMSVGCKMLSYKDKSAWFPHFLINWNDSEDQDGPKYDAVSLMQNFRVCKLSLARHGMGSRACDAVCAFLAECAYEVYSMSEEFCWGLHNSQDTDDAESPSVEEEDQQAASQLQVEDLSEVIKSDGSWDTNNANVDNMEPLLQRALEKVDAAGQTSSEPPVLTVPLSKCSTITFNECADLWTDPRWNFRPMYRTVPRMKSREVKSEPVDRDVGFAPQGVPSHGDEQSDKEDVEYPEDGQLLEMPKEQLEGVEASHRNVYISLDISGNHIGNEGGACIADLLALPHNSLTHLNLAGCGLERESTVRVMQAVSLAHSCVVRLELSGEGSGNGTNLSDSGTLALASCLLYAPSLRYLGIARSGLTVELLGTVGKALLEGSEKDGSRKSRVEVLDLSGNDIMGGHLEEFAVCFPVLANLRELLLADNQIGDWGACVLADKMRGLVQLAGLDLRRNNIEHRGFAIFSDAVGAQVNLEWLLMDGNNLKMVESKRETRKLLRMAEDAASEDPQETSGGEKRQTRSVGEYHFIGTLESLLHNKDIDNKLKKLSLRGKHLSRRLFGNGPGLGSSLRYLSLINCRVSDTFVTQLCESAKLNTGNSLSRLELARNAIGNQGALRIAEWIAIGRSQAEAYEEHTSDFDLSRKRVEEQVSKVLDRVTGELKHSYETPEEFDADRPSTFMHLGQGGSHWGVTDDDDENLGVVSTKHNRERAKAQPCCVLERLVVDFNEIKDKGGIALCLSALQAEGCLTYLGLGTNLLRGQQFSDIAGYVLRRSQELYIHLNGNSDLPFRIYSRLRSVADENREKYKAKLGERLMREIIQARAIRKQRIDTDATCALAQQVEAKCAELEALHVQRIAELKDRESIKTDQLASELAVLEATSNDIASGMKKATLDVMSRRREIESQMAQTRRLREAETKTIGYERKHIGNIRAQTKKLRMESQQECAPLEEELREVKRQHQHYSSLMEKVQSNLVMFLEKLKQREIVEKGTGRQRRRKTASPRALQTSRPRTARRRNPRVATGPRRLRTATMAGLPVGRINRSARRTTLRMRPTTARTTRPTTASRTRQPSRPTSAARSRMSSGRLSTGRPARSIVKNTSSRGTSVGEEGESTPPKRAGRSNEHSRPSIGLDWAAMSEEYVSPRTSNKLEDLMSVGLEGSSKSMLDDFQLFTTTTQVDVKSNAGQSNEGGPTVSNEGGTDELAKSANDDPNVSLADLMVAE